MSAMILRGAGLKQEVFEMGRPCTPIPRPRPLDRAAVGMSAMILRGVASAQSQPCSRHWVEFRAVAVGSQN